MSFGMIALLVLSLLTLFGLGQRVLDRLHLSDRTALFAMAAIAKSAVRSLRCSLSSTRWPRPNNVSSESTSSAIMPKLMVSPLIMFCAYHSRVGPRYARQEIAR